MINLASYDFVDFGCSGGNSIRFGIEQLGARHGLGLDIDPLKVAAAREAGFDAEVADITTLDPEKVGNTRFAILSHFLEHLPGRREAQQVIAAACRVSEQFVFVRQPYFDADGHLFSRGLKLYWSDWTGHPFHITSLDLYGFFRDLQARGAVTRFIIFFRSSIEDPLHPALHPIASPIDQHEWEGLRHKAKPDGLLDFPVYTECGAIAITGAGDLDARLADYLQSCVIAFDSDAPDTAAPSLRSSFEATDFAENGSRACLRISQLERRIAEQEAEIAALRSSRSWRLTAPMRRLFRTGRRFLAGSSN